MLTYLYILSSVASTVMLIMTILLCGLGGYYEYRRRKDKSFASDSVAMNLTTLYGTGICCIILLIKHSLTVI